MKSIRLETAFSAATNRVVIMRAETSGFHPNVAVSAFRGISRLTKALGSKDR